jgi:hypothetical protein
MGRGRRIKLLAAPGPFQRPLRLGDGAAPVVVTYARRCGGWTGSRPYRTGCGAGRDENNGLQKCAEGASRSIVWGVQRRRICPAAPRFCESGRVLISPEFSRPRDHNAINCRLATVKASVNRNYLPGHKQGGSVSRHTIDRLAPVIAELYSSAALINGLGQLSGECFQVSPAQDPHAYAMNPRAGSIMNCIREKKAWLPCRARCGFLRAAWCFSMAINCVPEFRRSERAKCAYRLLLNI